MMATINRTKVQGVNYPYAYFVVVFKGPKMVQVSSKFANLLQQNIVSTQFRCEFSVQAGDSVFVILPAHKKQFTTTVYDCTVLSQIMVATCNLILSCRDEIEQMTR